jgi:signal transduction histidine kinase
VSPGTSARDVGAPRPVVASANLLSGIAHEIRNALFTTRMTLDAIEVSRPDAAELSTIVESLRRQLEPLQDLAADLSLYSDPPTAEREGASFATLLQAAAERCADPRTGPVPTIEISEVSPAVRVQVEQSSMLRAITHLLTYAVRRSAAGHCVRPILTVDPAAGGIECSIEDNGPAVSDEDLPQLFEPFMPKSRGGADLRLATAQRIVIAHGGSLRAERGGVGVRLVLWLPGEVSATGVERNPKPA